MKFNEKNDETEVENKIKNAVGTIVGKTVITDMKIIEEKKNEKKIIENKAERKNRIVKIKYGKSKLKLLMIMMKIIG